MVGHPWSQARAFVSPQAHHADSYISTTVTALTHPAAAAANSLQSCLTLCNPMNCSPSGFSVHGILQAGTLEWVAISFSNAWKWKVKVKSLSRVRLSSTPWTVAYQAPPSMGFSRQEYWSGVPSPSPLYPHKHLLFLIFLMTTILKVCISLSINDV